MLSGVPSSGLIAQPEKRGPSSPGGGVRREFTAPPHLSSRQIQMTGPGVLLQRLLLLLVLHRCFTAIAPGKYSRLIDLDYFHLSVPDNDTVHIKYHGHTVKNVTSTFLSTGELVEFQFGWCKRKSREVISTLRAINDTHLMESKMGEEYIWRRVSENETRNHLAEIAILSKRNARDGGFLRTAFSSDRPPLYHWDGVYGINECPTTPVQYVDKGHSPTKIIGITSAHYRVWQEFYRRHRFGDWNTRIIILEGGIRCNYAFCGDVAIEHVKATDKDILFLGWCYFDMEAGFTAPPVCAHAYSLSVRAANVLMNNVFPCLSPVDGQIAHLCKEGLLTWETVKTGHNYSVPYKTVGLIRQDFF